MLTDILSPAARKKVYAVYAIVGVIVGAIQVAFVTIDPNALPTWLLVANAVYLFLGGAFGATAGSNIQGRHEAVDKTIDVRVNGL